MGKRLWMGGVLAVLLWFPSARGWAQEKVMSGLTEAELKKAFDELSPKWYPTVIKGYAKMKESRYDITWQKGNPGWYLFWDMSPAEFAKQKMQMSRKGMKVGVESSWTVKGEEHIAAIWRKK